MEHKRLGFTVVELAVVIVVIGILVAIVSIAYRNTQTDARNKKRETDVAVLMGAIEEYRADKGDYPLMTACTTAPSHATNGSGCWRNEIWNSLQTQGYLRTVPTPDTASPTTAHNINSGKANYGYRYHSSSGYSIYVPMEPASASCRTGLNSQTITNFSSVCSF